MENSGRPAAAGKSTGSYRHGLARPASYKIGYSLGKWLPRAVLFALADLLADATHWTNPEPARNLQANLRSAFPRWSEREVEEFSKRIFRNFARNLVDYGRFPTITDEALDRLLPSVQNLHFMEESFAKGKGVILVTGHIGNWELGALFFGRHGFKINVVTIPEGSERIDSIRGAYRTRQNIRTIVVDGSPFSSLEIVAALRRGEIVAMLVDRWEGADGVPAKFFGADRRFPRGPFVLGRAMGAPILPAFIVREGSVYRGVVDPPFFVEEPEDEPGARRVSESLERMVRACPDQWYDFAPR
ncbi:lysophospholipid acyltransferase family protein [Candidatus Deferrimicrobium sp.]|uniref:lysophospholipid acyltransferase family protein n=1 Tax=Candidatus Deferrimicrobium sp. TaxID=3060586 RepID=UPI002EDAAC5E